MGKVPNIKLLMGVLELNKDSRAEICNSNGLGMVAWLALLYLLGVPTSMCCSGSSPGVLTGVDGTGL